MYRDYPPPGIECQELKTIGHRRPTFVNKLFPHQILKEVETDTDTIKVNECYQYL